MIPKIIKIIPIPLFSERRFEEIEKRKGWKVAAHSLSTGVHLNWVKKKVSWKETDFWDREKNKTPQDPYPMAEPFCFTRPVTIACDPTTDREKLAKIWEWIVGEFGEREVYVFRPREWMEHYPLPEQPIYLFCGYVFYCNARLLTYDFTDIEITLLTGRDPIDFFLMYSAGEMTRSEMIPCLS